MKKFALALIGTFALVGFVMADEFTATIWKVEGNTVTFKKGFGGGFGGKGGEPAKEEKADVTSDVKVAKGEIDAGAFGGAGKKGAGGTDKGAFGKKAGGGTGKGGFGGGTGKGGGKGFNLNVKAGDPIEGGLKNEIFTKIDDQKGQLVQITTNDAGKITQILTVEFGIGGKKGGGKKGGE